MSLLLAALAFAAEGHGEAHEATGVPWRDLALVTGNVVIFASILIYVARRPIHDALHGRANRVRAALDEAQKLHDEASARYAEIDHKLRSLDAKIDEMKREAERASHAEAARIAERAEADAARIRDTAERTIREETTRAKNAIRQEAIESAGVIAREHLRKNVSVDDQNRLAGEFLGTVKGEA